MSDAARSAERFAALQAARAGELSERLRRFLRARGDERALDVGTGTGALALALAPLVREVVGVDTDGARLELAAAQAPANVRFERGDATALPFEDGAFDLVCTLRTLHHVMRPELALAEIARVARRGGAVLVVDQIAPVDPLDAVELDRFEHARDSSHTRLLPDADIRSLFDMNRLVLRREEHDSESRDLDAYLDLAGCQGAARERARGLAPAGYAAELGWYLLRKA